MPKPATETTDRSFAAAAVWTPQPASEREPRPPDSLVADDGAHDARSDAIDGAPRHKREPQTPVTGPIVVKTILAAGSPTASALRPIACRATSPARQREQQRPRRLRSRIDHPSRHQPQQLASHRRDEP